MPNDLLRPLPRSNGIEAELDADRFDGAHVDARAAIAARIGVDDGPAILHGNRVQGARIDTRLTSGAFFSVYNCCH
jgi:hypothetical protein